MLLNEEMMGDFNSLREENPCNLNFDGRRYKVVLSWVQNSLDLELGGFRPQRAVAAKLLKSELPAALAVGSLVELDGAAFRVESISQKPGLPIVTLNLQEP